MRNDRDQEEWNALLVDIGLRSKRSARRHSRPDTQVRAALATIPGGVNWGIVAGFALALAVLAVVLWIGDSRIVGPATLAFILVGWVFSLCLHEFTHAAVAVLGGDTSETTRRYLSFNPLHYAHPFLSVVLPLAYILIGGIGLPGGAVYLRHDLIRSRTWESAVSLAAPLMNLLVALLLALPLGLGLLDEHLALAGAFAVLAFFETMAALFNLLPIPPLDGFGVLAPWLPKHIAAAGYRMGNVSFLLLFLLIWYVQPVSDAIDMVVTGLLALVGVDPILIGIGLDTTFFWLH